MNNSYRLCGLAFLAALLTFASCKQSPAPVAQRSGLKLPFGILPAGMVIDGGWFSTLSGSYEGFPADTTKGMTAQVALSYHDWPGVITVKLDGTALTNYITDATPSGYPYDNHTWVVDSNTADSIPNINHTIRGVDPLDITSPALWDTVTRAGFTINWTRTSDTNTGATILFIPTPNSFDTTSADTLSSTLIAVADNGSYTFPSSMFTNIPSGFRIYVYIVRYALDIESIDSHNYAFLNGFQRGGIYLMR